jgi:hypothetical protein
MDIKPNDVYSISEASTVSKIPKRTLQNYCKRDKIKHQDNIYIIKGSVLSKWIEARQKTTLKRSNAHASAVSISVNGAVNKQLDLQVQALEIEIEKLKEENKNLKLELTNDLPHKEKLKKAIQLITLEALEQGIQHKIFTDEEYQDLIGTISEVDFQKEQVEYLRSRVEKQDEILTKLVNQVSEKNYIEARDKGYDKK